MNESIFFLQVLSSLLLLFFALKRGPLFLSATIALYALLSNLLVLKQVSLFGFFATASEPFAVASLVGLNLLQERFGKKRGKEAIGLSFFFLLTFTLFAKLHILFPSLNPIDSAYEAIFSQAPRLMAASIGVFFVVQWLDLYLFSFLRSRIGFPLLITLCVTQTIDTLLFSFFGLYGLVDSIGSVIVFSLIIKAIAIGASSLFFMRVRPNVFPV